MAKTKPQARAGARLAVKRRMGPETSASRDALFDAVERVLQKEGYAALSARRVAEEAGFNHQTVYYYFQTMEELVLGAFRRRVDSGLKRLEVALASEQPIQNVWRLYSDTANARLHIEFNALALQNEALKAEVLAYLEVSRAMQAKAFAPLLKERGVPKAVTPMVPAMLIMFVGNFLDREEAMGFGLGHKEMRAFADWCFETLEGPPEKVVRKRRK